MTALRFAPAILLLFPGVGWAQDVELGSKVLFHCALNNAQNEAKVILHADDGLTYSYVGPDGRLQMSLESTVAEVSLRPLVWRFEDPIERVTFTNGDTSYQVYRQLSRGELGRAVEVMGGVVVTSPSGDREVLQCDQYRIWPRASASGLTEIAKRIDQDHRMFDDCVSQARRRSYCFEVVESICSADDRTHPDKQLVCWGYYADRLDVLQSEAFQTAFERAGANGLDTSALSVAQELWLQSRRADCDAASGVIYNPLDNEIGQQNCMAEYSARRIDFLDAYTAKIDLER